jgi:hypothetical protein
MTNIILSAFDDDAFKDEIRSYVKYAPNVKLEKYIVFSFNKYFIEKKKISSILEFKILNKKHDIYIDGKIIDGKVSGGKSIEFKYYFDSDIAFHLKKYIENPKSNFLGQIYKESNKNTWNGTYGLLKDLYDKNCDYFIWIISQRDKDIYFEKYKTGENICGAEAFKKYHEKPKKTKDDFQTTIDKFNEMIIAKPNIKLKDKYSIEYREIEI